MANSRLQVTYNPRTAKFFYTYPVGDTVQIDSNPGGGSGNVDIVQDTTPQLGGDLDMNSKSISSGILGVKNQGSQSELRLFCEVNNAHYASIKAPAHGDFQGNITFTMPGNYGSANQVLTTDGSGGTSWADASGGLSRAQTTAIALILN